MAFHKELRCNHISHQRREVVEKADARCQRYGQARSLSRKPLLVVQQIEQESQFSFNQVKHTSLAPLWTKKSHGAALTNPLLVRWPGKVHHGQPIFHQAILRSQDEQSFPYITKGFLNISLYLKFN